MASKNKRISCIDKMEALLDKISEFKTVCSSPDKKENPNFKQEYRLFQQHIKWVSEDLSTPEEYNLLRHVRHKR